MICPLCCKQSLDQLCRQKCFIVLCKIVSEANAKLKQDFKLVTTWFHEKHCKTKAFEMSLHVS